MRGRGRGLPARRAERPVAPDGGHLAGRGPHPCRDRRDRRGAAGGSRGPTTSGSPGRGRYRGRLDRLVAAAQGVAADRRLEPRANVRRMSDASDPAGWEGRRQRWKVERLDPALTRAPERQSSFRTLGEIELEPSTARGTALRGRRRPADRAARRAAVHPRHPSVGLPLAPLDDADVRGLRGRRGHQRPVQGPARRGPDRPLDRLRHADPLRLRHRRRGGRGRVRDVRRRVSSARRHGGPARRPAARPRLDVDDDQLAGGADLGDVHRRGREGRLPPGDARGHDPERHPQGVHRPEGVPVPARAVDAPRDRHDRVRDERAAALEHRLDLRLPHPRGGLDRRPGAGVHDRRRDGLRRGGDGARPPRRRLRAAPLVLLQHPQRLLRGDREVPGVRAGSGTS